MTRPAESQETLDRLREDLAPGLELVRPLGEGSMGRVFLAREPALRRLVALKVLREELAVDDVARRRFEREAKAAASVSHPNVSAVHRVDHLPDGRPFIVMEHVDGRTVADLLAGRGPLPVAEARRVLAAVAGALAAAHRKGVVHRDVRPGNIMVEAETDRVVLVDFGIAALLETGTEHVTRLTRAGVRLGDPRHMSPEQLRGEPVTPASDIWGLGVLGYELLTGHGPFAAGSVPEALKAALEGDPPRLRELRRDTDPALDRLLRRCLARQPARRPRAAEVVDELGQAASPADVVAGHGAADTAVAAALPEPLREFLRELRRRKVYRVAAAYIAGGFILLEAADLVAPVLTARNPDFWYRVIVALTMAGFPVALVLSWMFDLEAGGPAGASPLSWKRRLLPLVGLALSIAAAAGVWMLLMR